MKKLKYLPLFIFFNLLSAFAAAQSDTGSGMVGTSVKESGQLLDAAGLQKRAECPLETAVGIVEIERIGNTQSEIIKKPVCTNESVFTQMDEKAVIYFRNGLIIELKPFSTIVIKPK
jgi:hypothetical protein